MLQVLKPRQDDKDIAFEFGMWISPEFKIYLIKEFQRLKQDENKRKALAWDTTATYKGQL